MSMEVLNYSDYFSPAEDATPKGVAAIIFGLTSILFGSMAISGIAANISVSGIVTFGIISAALLAGFAGERKRFKQLCHYRKYVQALCIDHTLNCSVNAMAAKAGVTQQTAIKELTYFMGKDWIRQGHFLSANQDMSFIVSDDLYEAAKEKAKEEEEKQAREREKAASIDNLDNDAKMLIENSRDAGKRMQAAADSIKDKAVSDKIQRMCSIVEEIVEEIQERPELAQRLTMFSTYYLPTSVKLTEAYAEMDAQPVKGDNILSAMGTISESIDRITKAYSTLFDSLYSGQSIDVKSEVRVMETMLKQEGLLSGDSETKNDTKDKKLFKLTM